MRKPPSGRRPVAGSRPSQVEIYAMGKSLREKCAKWRRGGASADEALVGSGDIQSLADLGNSFEVVRTMRLAPVTKEALLQLAVATLAPIVPLALTMMSLEDLLKRLVGLVF